MAISKLKIENFKGVSNSQEFEIRPITLFIGPNSSGKSSALHALAALAQTSKLPSSGRPLVLDDEYANVHLGRFIEVIHSKKYSDPIGIGFETSLINKSIHGLKTSQKLSADDRFVADFSFKSTKRTQDIYLERLSYASPDQNLSFKLNKLRTQYLAEFNNKAVKGNALYDSSLNVMLAPENTAGPKDFETFFYNQACKKIVAKELAGVLYLGPFRQSPLRRYPTRGSSPTEVGAQGEHSVTLLANEFVQTKMRPSCFQVCLSRLQKKNL